MDDIEIDFDSLEAPSGNDSMEVAPESVAQTVSDDKPVSFLSYLTSSVDMEYQKMFDFVLDTLHFANKVQTYHWSCSTGFQHEQFDTVVKMLRSFADKLAEALLSYSKRGFTFTGSTYSLTPFKFDLETAITRLEEYRDAARTISSSLAANRSITNIVDEMLAELDKQIGLLRNFQ